jgi:hypothetical protein
LVDVDVEKSAEGEENLFNFFEVEEVAEASNVVDFGLGERKFGVFAEFGPVGSLDFNERAQFGVPGYAHKTLFSRKLEVCVESWAM